jgi:hypothetical protein
MTPEHMGSLAGAQTLASTSPEMQGLGRGVALRLSPSVRHADSRHRASCRHPQTGALGAGLHTAPQGAGEPSLTPAHRAGGRCTRPLVESDRGVRGQPVVSGPTLTRHVSSSAAPPGSAGLSRYPKPLVRPFWRVRRCRPPPRYPRASRSPARDGVRGRLLRPRLLGESIRAQKHRSGGKQCSSLSLRQRLARRVALKGSPLDQLCVAISEEEEQSRTRSLVPDSVGPLKVCAFTGKAHLLRPLPTEWTDSILHGRPGKARRWPAASPRSPCCRGSARSAILAGQRGKSVVVTAHTTSDK